MTTYDFVHLVISAMGGKIEGRTKLQKVVYFFGVLTEELPNLGYGPHYYGPYSPAVANAVQELRGLKFLDERPHADGATDESGFEKIRYDYALTDEGAQVATEKAAQWPEEWARITDAAARFRAANVQDYVRLSIAAKTDLLTREADQPFDADALKLEAEKHGWKAFTAEQFADAFQFLTTVVGQRPQLARG